MSNCSGSIDYAVYNQGGEVVETDDAADCSDVISINACSVVGQTYRVYFENAKDSCWSNLTFKPSPCASHLNGWNRDQKSKRSPQVKRVRQG